MRSKELFTFNISHILRISALGERIRIHTPFAMLSEGQRRRRNFIRISNKIGDSSCSLSSVHKPSWSWTDVCACRKVCAWVESKYRVCALLPRHFYLWNVHFLASTFLDKLFSFLSKCSRLEKETHLMRQTYSLSSELKRTFFCSQFSILLKFF